MTFQILELLREDGTSPYAEWFDRLDAAAATKVATATIRMEQGNLSNVKWFRGIGEYRIDWGTGIPDLSGERGSEDHCLAGWWYKERATEGYRARPCAMGRLQTTQGETDETEVMIWH